MGDAAGIGPEITLKAIAEGVSDRLVPLIVGDLGHLRRLAEKLGLGLPLVRFPSEDAGIQVYDLANLPFEIPVGIDSETTGRASAENIEIAVDLWRRGVTDAMATAPISKKAIAMGGYDHPGHTEFIAQLTATDRFAMSFFAENLRVVLLSTHVSLRKAIELVQTRRLYDLIVFTHEQIGKLIGRSPRLAMAGLNPHASESGMFGTEEADEILPAIEAAREDGIDISGPYSPDTIFLRGFKGDFDAVVACYHDQATIAVKSLSFGSSVNVTLGLPLIRTSVDHGTAYDIAGLGIADASSMRAAIDLAGDLSRAS